MQPERWAPCPGHPDTHEVSDWGYVRERSSGRIYRGSPRKKDGYWVVMLHKRSHYLHVLVAQAFRSRAHIGLEVNHIDGDKDNNRAKNLEWVTHQRNMEHAAETGLRDMRGVKNKMSKLTEDKVRAIRNIEGRSHADIAAEFNVSRSTVTLVRARKIWRHV